VSPFDPFLKGGKCVSILALSFAELFLKGGKCGKGVSILAPPFLKGGKGVSILAPPFLKGGKGGK